LGDLLRDVEENKPVLGRDDKQKKKKRGRWGAWVAPNHRWGGRKKGVKEKVRK